MINLNGKKWLGIPIVFLVLLIGLGTGGIALAETVFYQAHVNLSVVDGLSMNYDNATNWDTETDTWSPPVMYPGQSVSTSLTVYNNGDAPVIVTVDTAEISGDAGAGAWFEIAWEDSLGGSGGGGFTVPAYDSAPGWVHIDITLETAPDCAEGEYSFNLSLIR